MSQPCWPWSAWQRGRALARRASYLFAMQFGSRMREAKRVAGPKRRGYARRFRRFLATGIVVLLGSLVVMTVRPFAPRVERYSRPPPVRRLVRYTPDGELILPSAEHEGTDVGRRFIGAAFALLLVSLAVITGGTLWLFPLPETDRTLNTPLPVYSEPRLQASPRQEMQRFLAEEREQLSTYGWIDKPHGVVRLPIDVAMEKVAQRGIQGWATSPAQAESSPSTAPVTITGPTQ